MAAPSMTYNAAGNVLASQSLAASGTVTADIDASTKLGVKLIVKNTPGASVSTTRGVRVEVFEGYGSTVVYTTVSLPAGTLPSTTASTAESQSFEYGPGKYRIKLTNLDSTNSVQIEVSSVSIDGIA